MCFKIRSHLYGSRATSSFLVYFSAPAFRALRKLVNDQQNNWDFFLDATLFSLRSKVHTTTKHTPFELMYGREARFPSEVPAELPVSFLFEFFFCLSACGNLLFITNNINTNIFVLTSTFYGMVVLLNCRQHIILCIGS